MNRREVLAWAGAIAAGGSFKIAAAPRTRVIGILNSSVPADVAASLEVFDSAMRQLGYIKGTDYVVLERMAAGRDDVLRAMAEELVARKVDLIFAGATNAVVEASRLTSTIPIVFVSVSNPVLSGFAESLAHPGRNVTGISNITRDLGPKRLELLKQMVPALARVSLLVNPASANYPGFVTRLQTFAPSLGVRTSILETRTPVEIDAAFAHLAESRDHGMYVAADAFLFNQRRQIAELALAKRLPTVSPAAECVESGGLMSYGVDSSDWMRLAAGYVDKIFRGAHPGDLPIEETSRVELVINRKTAAAMQMRIPPAMELQATRLID